MDEAAIVAAAVHLIQPKRAAIFSEQLAAHKDGYTTPGSALRSVAAWLVKARRCIGSRLSSNTGILPCSCSGTRLRS